MISPIVPRVGGSLVAVALIAIAAPAFAQDDSPGEPSVDPSSEAVPAEETPAEPPPPEVAPEQPAPVPSAPEPPPSVAQESALPPVVFDGPGIDFAARVGYALPFGNSSGDQKLSDGVTSALPLVLEVGYRVNSHFTIGALLQYGFVKINDSASTGCGGNVSCSSRVVRAGIEGIYNIGLDAALTPWVGIGTGYEWFSLSSTTDGQTTTVGAHGFEFVTLHAGADYRVSTQFALGPFVSLSVAEYATSTYDGQGVSASTELIDKKAHEWLQIGVRGRFGI